MAGRKKNVEEVENSKELFDGMTIEEGIAKLNEILNQMDRSDISLEDSFEMYNKGLAMVNELNERLTIVEKKLTIINE